MLFNMFTTALGTALGHSLQDNRTAAERIQDILDRDHNTTSTKK